jgi:hypothetical protein
MRHKHGGPLQHLFLSHKPAQFDIIGNVVEVSGREAIAE